MPIGESPMGRLRSGQGPSVRWIGRSPTGRYECLEGPHARASNSGSPGTTS
jgi:hypothetical protein